MFCPDGWNASRKAPSRGKYTGGEDALLSLKQDILPFPQTDNKTFLHPAEGEIFCQVLESDRNNPSQCGPGVSTSANGVSFSLM